MDTGLGHQKPLGCHAIRPFYVDETANNPRTEIPVDLQKALRRKEIKWTLKTSDYRKTPRLIKLEPAQAIVCFDTIKIKFLRSMARDKKRSPLFAMHVPSGRSHGQFATTAVARAWPNGSEFKTYPS